jgi:plastocyanin
MRLLFASSLAALTFGVVACGGPGPSPTNPNTPSNPPAAPITIDVAEINGPNSFYPSPVTVEFERVVEWRNSDTVTHHVVFDDRSLDTGTLAPGTLSQPFTVGPGTRTYHCSIHPTMVGSISVERLSSAMSMFGVSNRALTSMSGARASAISRQLRIFFIVAFA